MSERGSFVTEYIYDEDDLEVIKGVLINNEKYLKGIQIPSWKEDQMLPIVAGKVGALYTGGEIEYMKEILEPIVNNLERNIKVVIISDSGEVVVINTDDLKK